MTLARLRTMISLTGCLAISMCAMPGDFCDVVRGPLDFAPATARQIVATDRDKAEAIDVQNVYGRAHCGW